jgi:hypothetical protein
VRVDEKACARRMLFCFSAAGFVRTIYFLWDTLEGSPAPPRG